MLIRSPDASPKLCMIAITMSMFDLFGFTKTVALSAYSESLSLAALSRRGVRSSSAVAFWKIYCNVSIARMNK
jgi:hypothetical protein